MNCLYPFKKLIMACDAGSSSFCVGVSGGGGGVKKEEEEEGEEGVVLLSFSSLLLLSQFWQCRRI
jgi:hypothetical protein